MDGTCGVTSAVTGIERCETERRSDAHSGGPTYARTRAAGAGCVDEGACARREEVREE